MITTSLAKTCWRFIYNLRKNRLTPEQRVASSSPQRITRPPANTDYTHMYASEAIKNMSAELTYLRQEVEFLKKSFAAGDKKWIQRIDYGYKLI